MGRRIEPDWLGEGTTPWADAGVKLSDAITGGWLDGVTDEHHAKARAYWQKIEVKRQPIPAQGDLFA